MPSRIESALKRLAGLFAARVGPRGEAIGDPPPVADPDELPPPWYLTWRPATP